MHAPACIPIAYNTCLQITRRCGRDGFISIVSIYYYYNLYHALTATHRLPGLRPASRYPALGRRQYPDLQSQE